MSTKEALEALVSGQAFAFRSKIEEELTARSLEAIQTKRFEIGASMFEEVEGDITSEEVKSPWKKPRQLKDKKKEMMVHHPKTGVKVINKKDWTTHKASGHVQAEETSEELSVDAKQQRYLDIKKASLTSKKNRALKTVEKRTAARAKKDIRDEED